jgi:hypothetical protein
MATLTACTVWYYRSFDEGMKGYWRRIFFGVGSTQYHGGWMQPNESVWIVPGTLIL